MRRSLGVDASYDEGYSSPGSDSDGGQGSSVRASSHSSEGAAAWVRRWRALEISGNFLSFLRTRVRTSTYNMNIMMQLHAYDAAPCGARRAGARLLRESSLTVPTIVLPHTLGERSGTAASRLCLSPQSHAGCLL